MFKLHKLSTPKITDLITIMYLFLLFLCATRSPSAWSVGWVDSLEHQEEAGLYAREGLDSETGDFRPNRGLFLTTRGKIVSNSMTFHWSLKGSGNRELLIGTKQKEKVRPQDDIYYSRRRQLLNGSILDRHGELIVREAYLQWLEEGWLFQTGSLRYSWGTADFINPLQVVNPKDLRTGIAGEKDEQLLSTPSIRLSRLLDEKSLTLVFVPRSDLSLIPPPEGNWPLKLDNQRFGTRVIQDEKSRDAGSAAIKYDFSIPDGDVSALYYNGIDQDLVVQPFGLSVADNNPLILDLRQISTRKNAWGGSYQQTFDQILLKAEALYTHDKLAPKTFERSMIESLSFPIEMAKSPHVASTIGFNYFFKFRDILGIKVSDTVFTSEYYSQKFLRSDVLPGLNNQLLAANIRSGGFEDRLEILLTYIHDLAVPGYARIFKATFADESIKHSLSLLQLDGETPVRDDIGSAFYYYRKNDSLSYAISYGF